VPRTTPLRSTIALCDRLAVCRRFAAFRRCTITASGMWHVLTSCTQLASAHPSYVDPTSDIATRRAKYTTRFARFKYNASSGCRRHILPALIMTIAGECETPAEGCASAVKSQWLFYKHRRRENFSITSTTRKDERASRFRLATAVQSPQSQHTCCDTSLHKYRR
jgi:hypothetical protein